MVIELNTYPPLGLDLSCVPSPCAVAGIGKFKAKGNVQLTNVRILFMAKSPSVQHGHPFRSFDVPIRAITNVHFNQPIFGCNNLTGKTHPISCLGVSQEVSWTCFFMEGGTGTFVPVFLRLMDRASAETQQQQQPVMASPVQPQQPMMFGAVQQPPPPPYAYPSQPQYYPSQQPSQYYPFQQPSQYYPPQQPQGSSSLPVAVPLTAYVDPSDPSKVLTTVTPTGGSNEGQQQQQAGGSGLPAPSAPPGL